MIAVIIKAARDGIKLAMLADVQSFIGDPFGRGLVLVALRALYIQLMSVPYTHILLSYLAIAAIAWLSPPAFFSSSKTETVLVAAYGSVGLDVALMVVKCVWMAVSYMFPQVPVLVWMVGLVFWYFQRQLPPSYGPRGVDPGLVR